jgi:hypothetical protein
LNVQLTRVIELHVVDAACTTSNIIKEFYQAYAKSAAPGAAAAATAAADDDTFDEQVRSTGTNS